MPRSQPEWPFNAGVLSPYIGIWLAALTVGAAVLSAAIIAQSQAPAVMASPPYAVLTPTSSAFVPAAFVTMPADSPLVAIQGFGFRPKIVTVTVGSSVRWIEVDGNPGEQRGLHNVASVTDAWVDVPCGKPTDPCMRWGEVFSVVFNSPGRFDYLCDPHPFMTGTVVVLAN